MAEHQIWVEKTVHWVETHWLSDKVPDVAVMLTVFWDMKVSISIDFLEKGATINGASYCRNP